jgi:hypothetical protein
MRGRGMYFYALKEDFLENIKELEKKFGGLQYIKAGIYKSNNFEIYDSIEDLPDIGTIRQNTINGIYYEQWRYFVIFKGEEFEYEKRKNEKGEYNHSILNTKGTIIFKPSGLYADTNCVIRGDITTISEDEKAQLLFKEFKKALLKSMMYVGGGIHVGKEVIENKEKYRLPYGMPWSDPIADFNLSDVEWKEKGKKK